MRASRSHGGLREHFLVRIIFQDWKESKSRKIKNTFLGCCFAATMIVLIFVCTTLQPARSFLAQVPVHQAEWPVKF